MISALSSYQILTWKNKNCASKTFSLTFLNISVKNILMLIIYLLVQRILKISHKRVLQNYPSNVKMPSQYPAKYKKVTVDNKLSWPSKKRTDYLRTIQFFCNSNTTSIRFCTSQGTEVTFFQVWWTGSKWLHEISPWLCIPKINVQNCWFLTKLSIKKLKSGHILTHGVNTLWYWWDGVVWGAHLCQHFIEPM